MSDEINVKVDKDLAKKVLKIARKKYPLRKIVFHTDAVREIIIDFIKKNKKYLSEEMGQKDNSIESGV